MDNISTPQRTTTDVNFGNNFSNHIPRCTNLSNMFEESSNNIETPEKNTIEFSTPQTMKSIFSCLPKISTPLTKDKFCDLCAVCLEPLKDTSILEMTSCKHLFHEKCIREAKCIKSLCPLCRCQLTPPEKELLNYEERAIYLAEEERLANEIASREASRRLAMMNSQIRGVWFPSEDLIYSERNKIAENARRVREKMRISLERNNNVEQSNSNFII